MDVVETKTTDGRRPGDTLRAAGVSRSFQGVQALAGVDLELHDHEVVGLIGPNGAGKSTLVNLLTGFDRADEGSVELSGRDVTRWSPDRRGRAGLTRTFQHSHAFRGLSVRENVEVAALGTGASPRDAHERADGLLAGLGLTRYADAPAANLPHGHERSLGVARALATRPRFVLMDEPAAGLPEAEVSAFAEVVRSVRDEYGAGVLLIDHNMALVMDVCDRIYVLDQGRMLAGGRPDEIRANLDVAAAYLGDSAVREDVAVSGPLLEVEALEVRYGAVPAVRDLSFEVGEGEIVGLIGPNGAGKTTTLLAIMGGLPVSSGDLRLAGRSLRGRAPEAIARAGVALVPEGRRIYGDLTVDENLQLGLAARSDRSGAAADLEAAFELFPIVGEFRRRHAGALSGGQQQQLAIARALVARPRLLLLDEPSLGLAPKIVDIVFDALAEIRKRGVTVLLVEQRAQRTISFADRTYLIANGELRLVLDPQDAADTDRLVAAYLS